MKPNFYSFCSSKCFYGYKAEVELGLHHPDGWEVFSRTMGQCPYCFGRMEGRGRVQSLAPRLRKGENHVYTGTMDQQDGRI